MKNNNDDALANYFSSMLTEPKSASASVPTKTKPEQLNIAMLPETLRFAAAIQQPEVVQPELPAQVSWENIEVEESFQALFFELSGMVFAVPLIDLGGIYHLDNSINTLFGKPDWFSGVITHNKKLFNIVDTAKWVSSGESSETLNYSHYIVLGTTQWGLSCEKLIGTENIAHSQIKWRQSPGRRPWVAGMVKEKMCTLIHVEELVKLLNIGCNIHGN